jgi:Tfp pilus assembly protein PilE
MRLRVVNQVTAPRLGVFMQVVVACILALTAIVAWSNWKAESNKRQTDATLRYFDRLMERDYIRYLWEIEEFTLCFERSAKGHLSYARFGEVRNSDDAFKLAAKWWDLVENEDKEMETCGRPDNIEEKLMVVYGRLEALSSCAKQKLCSFVRIVDMIEAFDHMTLLSVSNYLLLTRDRDRKISREWTMSGALVDLVELIEKYVFESRSSAAAYAAQLDAKGPSVENAPTLRPAEISAMRNKQTRCDRPEEATSDAWRRCARPDK